MARDRQDKKSTKLYPTLNEMIKRHPPPPRNSRRARPEKITASEKLAKAEDEADKLATENTKLQRAVQQHADEIAWLKAEHEAGAQPSLPRRKPKSRGFGRDLLNVRRAKLRLISAQRSNWRSIWTKSSVPVRPAQENPIHQHRRLIRRRRQTTGHRRSIRRRQNPNHRLKT